MKGGGAAAVRVGTASQPASKAAESEAAHGEMGRLENEITRLKAALLKKEQRMDTLARYAFNRYNSLATEAKEFARLYVAARSNCKEGVFLPEMEVIQANMPLGGKVFTKMYADANILRIDSGSEEEGGGSMTGGGVVSQGDHWVVCDRLFSALPGRCVRTGEVQQALEYAKHTRTHAHTHTRTYTHAHTLMHQT